MQSIQNAHNFYFSENTLNHFVLRNGFKVVNADDSDLRFLDGDNIIAGLLAKGKAKNDYSGFVLDN